MGTRADFYVGKDPKTMEWLGSIAWDGYPDAGGLSEVFEDMPEEDYRARVKKLLAGRDDGTTPDQGWPWPWEDSRTTDFAYTWADTVVHVSGYGRAWVSVKKFLLLDDDAQEEYMDGFKEAEFPNMKDVQNVDLGKRSGLVIVPVPKT